MTFIIVPGCHRYSVALALTLLVCGWGNTLSAAVLWSHPETVWVSNNGQGEDILRGAIKPQTSNSSGTLYFRVKVDPIADTAAKVIGNFEAGFMLDEKGQEHLGIGNATGAMAYSPILNVSNAPKGFRRPKPQVSLIRLIFYGI